MARQLNREHLAELRRTGRAKDEVLSDMAETLDELGESVCRLERSITGDPEAGHTGLIARSKDHHKRLARIERIVFYGTGVIMTATLFWDEIKARFFGPR